MNPERWQQIDQLFHAALACEPGERAAFLANQCAGDTALRSEVESLLSSLEEADDFIETPAGDVAAELLGTHKSAFEPGQQIQNYRIVRELGSGGMGEVFLAEDTRLNRKVALKLLPPHFTVNPDRVRRFEREARAASALNHPNIVTIYEIGQSDTTHFIATEFVDGKTLRQLINEKPFTLNETLNVSMQVADALSGAHAAGIVHRDIKPENIMIRRDGYVKILDFGLAKLTEQQTQDSDLETPTLLQSNPGLVMGTVQYMSPEQARAKNVGVGTDIWSLGIVIYELLAGHVPFTGETPSHVMVSLMEDKLPPLKNRAELPDELDRFVTQALRKNQKERYQTAAQLARDLKHFKQKLQRDSALNEWLKTVPSEKGGAQRPLLAPVAAVSGGHPVQFETRVAAETTPLESQSTSSAEYLVRGIKTHRTLAFTALVVIILSALGLTYLSGNWNNEPLPASGTKSIAVLPAKPIDATARDEVYELGVADSLINRLNAKGFIVRPLESTRKYATPDQDPIAAGREQKVDYVLASTYQIAGNKIRINAQLFEVASGRSEASYTSEKDATNGFATQDALATEFTAILMSRFATTSSVQAAQRGTTNKEAYRLYLHGKNLTMKRNNADAKKAFEYFEQAIQLDQKYASAYAGWAGAYLQWSILGTGTRAAAEKARAAVEVREALRKALELDNNLAEAYAVRADLTFTYEWDLAQAEKDLLHAIKLEPNSDHAHWLYALVLSYRGRFDEAMTEIETAQAIDPGALMYMRDRGRILYYARRYDEAIVQLKRIIDLDENFASAYGWLSHAYALKGDYAGAYQTFIADQKLRHPDRVKIFQKAYQTAGWQEVGRKRLEFFKINEHKPESSYFDIARSCAMLGEKDQAFEYLNKAVERREWPIIMLNVDPALDSLRGDPRFTQLVKRVGLN